MRKLIGVVAPASRLEPSVAERVRDIARGTAGEPEILFHPQCFLSSGHFAGDDEARARAFLDVANDPNFSALWIGRGGYGSGRIAGAVIAGLTAPARDKLYFGYSDAGAILAGLYKHGCRVAHGPMPADILRDNGEEAVGRALAYLVDHAPETIEPSLTPGAFYAAFNLTVFSHLLGTALEPDLTDHVLMLEDISEHLYRIDRAMFHVTETPSVRKIAGLRLGRVSDILPNDPDFGEDEEAIVKRWCDHASIAYLGRADIGHDAANKVVPFGRY
jgi:muramoyltetrapeptide carboxypeptidase